MASTAAKYIVLLSNQGIAYQFRDEFTTDAAAPMGTSPITRTAEPGPGQTYLVQQNGVAEWQIVNGILKLSANSTVLSTMRALPVYPRSTGLAFKHRSASNVDGTGDNAPISPGFGWCTNGSIIGSGLHGALYWGTTGFRAVDNSNSGFYGIDESPTETFFTWTHILRSTGGFSILGDRLFFVHARLNSTPMYAVVGQVDGGRHTPMIDYARVAQLGGPWATDYGIATDRLAGARAAGDTFTHEANALWLEFMLTTLPSSGSITIGFRKQDANNYWQLSVSDTGTFALNEVVAGTPTARLIITSCANGDRLMLIMDGANARLMRSRNGAGTVSTTYTSVSTFTTQTSGAISSLGTGGAISDLVTWPRVLSGDALAWVNAL